MEKLNFYQKVVDRLNEIEPMLKAEVEGGGAAGPWISVMFDGTQALFGDGADVYYCSTYENGQPTDDGFETFISTKCDDADLLARGIILAVSREW